jgi:hypothetical protein
MTCRTLALGHRRTACAAAVALWSTVVVSLSFCSIAPVYGASFNVALTPEVTAKFPHLRRVLKNLVETLNTPALWGDNLKLKVPDTGFFSFGKSTIGEINADFVKYLTDGKLRLTFRPDAGKKKGVAADTYCHTVLSTNDIAMALHPSAGSWRSQTAPYSDYDLAVTIYHELLHAWQFHHEVAPSCYILTKETPAYFLEAYLPKDLFDTKTCPDPGGSTPVFCPPTALGVTLKVQVAATETCEPNYNERCDKSVRVKRIRKLSDEERRNNPDVLVTPAVTATAEMRGYPETDYYIKFYHADDKRATLSCSPSSDSPTRCTWTFPGYRAWDDVPKYLEFSVNLVTKAGKARIKRDIVVDGKEREDEIVDNAYAHILLEHVTD